MGLCDEKGIVCIVLLRETAGFFLSAGPCPAEALAPYARLETGKRDGPQHSDDSATCAVAAAAPQDPGSPLESPILSVPGQEVSLGLPKGISGLQRDGGGVTIQGRR